jgi:PKD repeat protein
MKKRFFVYLASLSFALQTSVSAQGLNYCGTTEATAKLMKENPQLAEKIRKSEEEFWKNVNQSMAQKKTSSSAAPVYIIPVVFHIIHDYGDEYLSDEQIYDQMRILNEDFRKLNADTVDIVPQFKNLAADCEIEFRLAQLDPNGNCTNGIDRISSTTTYGAGDNAKLNQWDPAKYLNVWVVRSIGQSGVAGYAYFPATANNIPEVDGILILSDYIGSIGTSSPFTSRALTHEIGHYLSLAHVWGGTNEPGVACGDDGIGDTPVTKGFRSCPLNNAAQCDTNIVENLQNYMDYAYCYRMFTLGQRYVMRYTLGTFTANRDNLWKPANLAATGTDGRVPAECSPLADFNANIRTICAGTPLDLTSFATEDSLRKTTSWEWQFPGADQATSALKNPKVIYSNPGTYDVTLIASNSVGKDTITKKNYFQIVQPVAWYGMPYEDSFEVPYLSQGWTTQGSSSSVVWSNSTASYTGNNSVKLSSFNGGFGFALYSLISPRLDFSKTSGATMTFRVAYANKRSGGIDYLNVLYSKDCGASWNLMKKYKSSDINMNGLHSGSFTPTKTTNWKQLSIPIPAAIEGKTPVMLKFEYEYRGFGNNFYIEDINISGVTSIDEVIEAGSLELFPNPAEESTTLSFSLLNDAPVSISVFDLLGREVSSVARNTRLSAGNNRFTLSIPEKGVYLVKINIQGRETVKKLVIN